MRWLLLALSSAGGLAILVGLACLVGRWLRHQAPPPMLPLEPGPWWHAPTPRQWHLSMLELNPHPIHLNMTAAHLFALLRTLQIALRNPHGPTDPAFQISEQMGFYFSTILEKVSSEGLRSIIRAGWIDKQPQAAPPAVTVVRNISTRVQ